MNGKGSKPRPFSVPFDQYCSRFDSIFNPPANITAIQTNNSDHYLHLSKDEDGEFIVKTLGKVDYDKITKVVNIVREDKIKAIFIQWAKDKGFHVKLGLDLFHIILRDLKQECDDVKFKQVLIDSPYIIDLEDNSVKYVNDIYNHYSEFIGEECFYEVYDYNKTLTGVTTGKAEFLFGLFTQLQNSNGHGDLSLGGSGVEIKAIGARLVGQHTSKRKMVEIENNLNLVLGNISLPKDEKIGSCKVSSNRYIMNIINQYVALTDDEDQKHVIIEKVLNCYRSFNAARYYSISKEFANNIIEWCKDPIINEMKFRYAIASIQTMCYLDVETFKHIVFVNLTNYICCSVARDFISVESMFAFLNKYIKVYGSCEDMRMSYNFELKKL